MGRCFCLSLGVLRRPKYYLFVSGLLTYLPDLCVQVVCTEEKTENNHEFVSQRCFSYLGESNALEHNCKQLSLAGVLANILSEFV